MTIYRGKYVRYHGKEYQITSVGRFSLRLERGGGQDVIVLPLFLISELEECEQ